MSPLISTLLRHKPPVAALVLFSLVCATALCVRSRAARPSAVARVRQREALATESLTLRPSGFEPAEITRPAGRFLLAVDNHSALDEISLRLERDGSGKLYEVHLTPQKQNWRQVIDLAPGSYTLTGVNQPGWACRITVTD